MPIDLLVKLSSCEMPVVLDGPGEIELAKILHMAGLIKAKAIAAGCPDRHGTDSITVSGVTSMGIQMLNCFAPGKKQMNAARLSDVDEWGHRCRRIFSAKPPIL